MRKHILLIGFTLLLSALCLFSVSAADKVVYLSAGADGTGASTSDPVGSLADAYNALGDEGGTIVFMNEYSVNAKIDLPKHSGKITWTSVYDGTDYRTSGAALKWTNSVRIGLGGPTEIDYLTLRDTSTGAVLAANFHDLTIGENVSVANPEKLYLIGGANNDATVGAFPAGKSCTVTVLSGSFNTIVAFSRTVANVSHNGTVHLHMGGNATAIYCYLGSNGNAAKAGTTVFTMTDNAAVTNTLYLAGASANTNGSVTVNVHDNASVKAILRYLATYFPNGTRTLNYEETASLPANLGTYFGSVNVIESEEPDTPDVPEEPIVLEVVYVSEGASGTGASPSDPVGSLAKAYALLDPEKDGTVVLVGKVTIAENLQLPSHTNTVTVTSVYGGTDYRESGAALAFSGEHHLGCGGATVFDGITLLDNNTGEAQIASIAGNFHPLTFGEDVTCVNKEGNPAYTLFIVGGGNNDPAFGALAADKSGSVTVKSGTWRGIIAFSRRVANLSHMGTMTVSVSGSTALDCIYLGTMGTNAKGGTTVCTIEDNVTVNTLYLANYTAAKSNGTVSVTVRDTASVGALDKAGAEFFETENARSLCHALTASVPTNAFDSVTLTDVGYLTVADRALDGLTLASVDALNVTAFASASDGAITLPYPDAFTAFPLTLTYKEGNLTTTYTYAVTVENGVATATLTGTESFDDSTVYVKDGGTGNGFSPATPVGSIDAAHALLPGGGTVVLVGETTITTRSTLPAYTGVMTYTSVYDGVDYRKSGARLYFPSGITVILGGEAIFKDIAIHTDTYTYICAAFHPLTFDTGVVTTMNPEEDGVKKSDGQNGLRLAGGYNATALGEVTVDSNASITVRSGFFRHIIGFSRYGGKTTYTGTANLTVEGTAHVDEMIVGAVADGATAANAKLTVKEDATIWNVYIGGKAKENLLTGSFDMVVYGGDIYEIDVLSLHMAANCRKTFTYDVNTVPEGFPFLAELAQFNVVQTFCERDGTHNYSEPAPSEFDASILTKRCSVCGDVRLVGDLPDSAGENVVFVAEGGLGDGSHASIPTNDLYSAFKKLETSGGTIVIMNAFTIEPNTKQKIGGAPEFFQEPLHTGAITVTSLYGETDYRAKGAKLVFDGNIDYKLGGPVTFDHIVFDATEATARNTIAARYNPIVIGEDVTMLRDMDDAYCLDLIGGYLYFRYTDFTDVVIEDELLEMVNPARILTADPKTGDYTIDPNNITYVEKDGVTSSFFLRKAAGDSINKMFADMHALGLKRPNWISYAWRGYSPQYDGYTRQLADYRINQNKTYTEAHNWVITHCSIPGASEHHLGLACDFHDADVGGDNPHGNYDKTAEWAWLMQNAHKYGFILRFTPKNTAETGFIYEAWHFRYIGTEHAAEFASLNADGDPVNNAEMLLKPEWCLEEYAGLKLGMYDLDSSVTVNGGTFAHVEGGSRYCENIPLTGESNVTIGENATVMPEGTTYDVVFFSAGATGNGLSAASPIGTPEKAYALLGKDGGTLVWMSNLTVSAATEMPAHEGTVTITSVYDGIDYRESGAALTYTAAIRVAFNGPTCMENFTIVNAHGGDHLLCANFQPLTLGDGMLLVDKNGAVASTLIVIGGGNNNLSVGTLDTGESNTLTVKSGTYKQIVAFSGYNTNLSHTGTVYLNLSGDASAASVYLGAKATGSSGGSTVLTMTDNASIGTLYLANEHNVAITSGDVTVYAKDEASITEIEKYDPKYFSEDSVRTLCYAKTATLPENFADCFDTVNLLTEEKPEPTGDANGDGVITLVDVVRALRATAEPTADCSLLADMDSDGVITIADVLLILKAVLNA